MGLAVGARMNHILTIIDAERNQAKWPQAAMKIKTLKKHRFNNKWQSFLSSGDFSSPRYLHPIYSIQEMTADF